MIYLLPHTIETSAELFPEQEAFRFQDTSLTYQTLVLKSNSLANLLVDRGVKKCDRVGVYLSKSWESAIAIYGIMKAGAAYVPIDPNAPIARLEFIIRNCEISCLITQPNKRSQLAELLTNKTPLQLIIGLEEGENLPLNTISWSMVWQIPGNYPPQVRIIESDLAYIMYTSGSTGEPKGIMHTHHSGLSYARQAARTYQLNHRDRLGNHSPLHFDMSTLEYLASPLVGATTVIIPEVYTKFPINLAQLIEDERLTIWYSVPFALIQLLLRGTIEQRNLNSLRWILFGGEPFPPKYLHQLRKKLPQARFSNVYGPAEINQCSYYHLPPIKSDADLVEESIPIGKIWANAEELVVDERDIPVEPGEVGELLVRTPTMMRGYWQRKDLNQKAFYRRPVWGDREDIFYRTGDLVQQHPDGNYRFVGRKDRQIKTRGYRIELDEIETAIVSHDGIEEAGVFSVPDRQGSQYIQAVVTTKPETDIKPRELIAYLTSLLPKYAIPVKIAIASELPRTTSGKIDRRTLQQQATNSQLNSIQDS